MITVDHLSKSYGGFVAVGALEDVDAVGGRGRQAATQ